MSVSPFFDDSQINDPTWKRAVSIAAEQLHVPSNLWNLFRGGWNESLSIDEFVRMLAFARLNPYSLLLAANIHLNERTPDAGTILQAVELLGLRYSSTVLAVNYCGRAILRTYRPTVWRPVFENMMTYIEIGSKLGSHVTPLAAAGGAIIGFSEGLGLAVLLAHDAAAFKRWYSLTGGYENKSFLLDSFGCEPYQVSACALQQLGFGTELAFGAALAHGGLDVSFLKLDREQLKWKAAFLWIRALREGRGYPADPEMRNFFSEIAPPKEGRGNMVLEVLYTEVAKVKREGSSWVWHLPKPSYDETLRMHS